MILGIDIGRVIIGGDGKDDTSFFTNGFLLTPELPAAIDSIAKLAPLFDAVYLVSKCGEKVQHKSKTWLYWNKFSERTGIPEENFRFCLTRPEKAPICKELGITHFIDDKLDVLDHMHGIVDHRYLFRGKPRDVQKIRYKQGVTAVDSWDAILKKFNLSRWS
jgi:hypothetical protein